MTRTAREVVNLYVHTLWDDFRPELVLDLCANPMIRHYCGERVELTHEEQISRIESVAEARYQFEDVVLHDDGTFVTHIWNATGDEGRTKWSGIEVFKVENGLITEVWNGPYGEEPWQ